MEKLASLPINSIRLIGYTQPEPSFKKAINPRDLRFDALELIAYCARVSNPSNQMNFETSERLVRYLIKNKHWSPLEMVHATCEVETPRDIARQMLRHRSFSFQEFSQRYADVVDGLSFVIREARWQDPDNRQNSIDTVPHDIQAVWQEKQKRVIDEAQDAYMWALQQGIAKECARVVLPEGNTMSRLYMSGTMRSWIHYIDLRSENGTQKEHMDVARMCANVINKVFPLEMMK